MAERHRSQDGHRETEDVLGVKPEELPEPPDHGNRAGGELQRKVGPIASFTAHSEALDAEDLARCNG